MARPRQVSDADILDAARACFLEHGPAVSTNVIADRLGISSAALFKRFGTKDQLMRDALMPTEDPDFVSMLQVGPDDRPIDAQLRELVLSMVRFFDRFMPCFATLRAAGVDLYEEMAKHPVPPPVQNHRLLAAWLGRAVEAGRVRPIDCDAVASMVIGAVNGRSFLSHLGQTPLGSPEGHVDAVVSVLWKGICPEESA
ncbi:MAG: TetR/AcrR family transcriptional regulator [Alphaproteobacteria bacterium]|nr:TetR/AcrR family transcriptional regulator [Alphaproteobacteria bacterium]MCB9697211.1 TetR/AcrR family transcriptional regulator [Alphaproteobacteria bacterium]